MTENEWGASNAARMAEQQRKTIGTIVKWHVDDGQLMLTVKLASPVNSAEIMDGDPELSDDRDVFRNGSPLGTKIESCFDGRRESGTIEISIFDKSIILASGVPAANGPRFLDQVLTVRRD
jgi:hypothetical protein